MPLDPAYKAGLARHETGQPHSTLLVRALQPRIKFLNQPQKLLDKIFLLVHFKVE